jgi:hypothetical protein
VAFLNVDRALKDEHFVRRVALRTIGVAVVLES